MVIVRTCEEHALFLSMLRATYELTQAQCDEALCRRIGWTAAFECHEHTISLDEWYSDVRTLSLWFAARLQMQSRDVAALQALAMILLHRVAELTNAEE